MLGRCGSLATFRPTAGECLAMSARSAHTQHRRRSKAQHAAYDAARSRRRCRCPALASTAVFVQQVWRDVCVSNDLLIAGVCTGSWHACGSCVVFTQAPMSSMVSTCSPLQPCFVDVLLCAGSQGVLRALLPLQVHRVVPAGAPIREGLPHLWPRNPAPRPHDGRKGAGGKVGCTAGQET